MIPKSLQLIYAYLQLLKAIIFDIEPKITSKLVRRAFYDWELNTDKASNELGLQLTPIEIGMSKTIDYIKSLRNFE